MLMTQACITSLLEIYLQKLISAFHQSYHFQCTSQSIMELKFYYLEQVFELSKGMTDQKVRKQYCPAATKQFHEQFMFCIFRKPNF